MKKAFYFLMFATLTMLTACEKNEDKGQVIAQTPVLTCNIPGQTNCNPGVYQQAGWQVTAYQYSYSNGFCGCPVGSRPVISPQYGIGCAPAGAFQPQVQYAGYGTPSNGHWTNTPQISFNPAISGTNNCYADAAKSCSVRGVNTCASGQTCRPVGGASDLGLCTSGYGQENYEHPRNCGYTRDGYGRWQYICSTTNTGYGYGSGYGYGGSGVQVPR